MQSATASPGVPVRGLFRAAMGTCLLGLVLTSLLCGAVRKIEYDRTQA